MIENIMNDRLPKTQRAEPPLLSRLFLCLLLLYAGCGASHCASSNSGQIEDQLSSVPAPETVVAPPTIEELVTSGRPEQILVASIAEHEIECRIRTQVQQALLTKNETVDHGHAVSHVEEVLAEDGTDVSGASGHQYMSRRCRLYVARKRSPGSGLIVHCLALEVVARPNCRLATVIAVRGGDRDSSHL